MNTTFLTDMHKQKLWADFLQWSNGKTFYDFPLYTLDGSLAMESWLAGLPEHKHNAILGWVCKLQRDHLLRDNFIQSTYSKDWMYEKCFECGIPVHFGEVRKADLSKILAETVSQSMIGFVVSSPALMKIQAVLGKAFEKAEPIHDLHASIAQIPGSVEKEELLDQLADIEHYKVKYQAVAMDLFEGRPGNPYDYIALKLKPSQGFVELYRNLNKALPLKEMPGGFKSHLSLARIPKGSVKKEEVAKFKFSPFVIEPVGVGLWDSTFKLVEELPIEVKASATDGFCDCCDQEECVCKPEDCHCKTCKVHAAAKEVKEFELEDIGVESPDYFQGRGTSHSKWDEVFVGIGESYKQALSDALDQMYGSGIKPSLDLEKEVEKASKKIEKMGEDQYYHAAIYVKM